MNKRFLKLLPLASLLAFAAPKLMAQRTEGGRVIPAHRLHQQNLSPTIIFPSVKDTLAPDLSIRLALQGAIRTVRDTLNADKQKEPISIVYKINVLESFIAECDRIARLDKYRNTAAAKRVRKALNDYDEIANAMTENHLPMGDDPITVLRCFYITVARQAYSEREAKTAAY